MCNIRFLRQRSIGKYIVDFYAPSLKLAIELDGAQHFIRQLRVMIKNGVSG